MLFRFAPSIAPKGYSFKDPDTGYPFKGISIADVAAKVRAYRMQNELEDLPYLETVIESYLCKLPENAGGCEPLPKLKRGLYETIKGGMAVIKTMLYQRFASQEVADARAEQCASCPLNTFYDKGPFVEWADDIAEQVVGDRRSKHHDKLGVCAGCSCGLRFKVFYDGPIDLKDRQIKKIRASQPTCWQLKNDRR